MEKNKNKKMPSKQKKWTFLWAFPFTQFPQFSIMLEWLSKPFLGDYLFFVSILTIFGQKYISLWFLVLKQFAK
jgi:hypothetical protein